MNDRELLSVYVIEHKIEGPVYVGQTVNVVRRWRQHQSDARAARGLLICGLMRLQGLDNFRLRVLETCETPEQMNEAEKAWILRLGTKFPNGANKTDGGETTWVSSDTRRRMSEAKKGKQPRGTGWHHSPETRRRMSKPRPPHNQGQDHPGAKLSNAQRDEIVALRTSGMTQQVVADDFGIHRTRVSQLWSGADMSYAGRKRRMTA